MFYKYNAELLCLFSHVSSCFHDGPSDNLHMLHSSKMIQFLPLASLPWQPDSFLEPTFLLAYHPQPRGRRPAPDWLVQQITSDWFERYSHCVENYRLPKAENQRLALAQQIGVDGMHLLQALQHPDAPGELSDIESVQMLRQIWQQYYDLSGGK